MMKNIRYGTFATLVLSLFLLTACGNKAEETVSSFAPSSSQVASTSSSSSSVSSKSSSKVSSVASSSEASSAVETPSSPAAVTEISSAPVAQGAVAPESALVSGGNQLQSVEEPTSTLETVQPASTDTVDSSTQLQPRFHPTLVSPGVVAGNWSSWSINSDGSVNNLPIAIVDYLPQESGIVHLHYMETISGVGGYIHYYPAGVAIPFENFSDPTDISRERIITGNGGYLGIAEENLENLFYPNLSYRQ